MQGVDWRVGEVEVMVLGVYHMAGSTKDVYNLEVDDVLSPKRQREIEVLVESLARWAPEAVAVEELRDKEEELNALYEQYVRGEKHFDQENQLPSMSRSEVVQIGFRVAKLLGHARVLAVDWFPEYPEWYPESVTEDVIREVMSYKPSDVPVDPDKVHAQDEQRLKESSVGDYLYWLNSQPAVSTNDALMYSIALEHQNKKGAFTVMSKWFERNLGIVRNLKEALPAGTKRVLLIYGSGHVPALRYIMEVSPKFCPVSPLPYLKTAEHAPAGTDGTGVATVRDDQTAPPST